MKRIIFAALFFFSLGAHAQWWQLGIHTGMTMSQMRGEWDNDRPRYAAYGGLGVDYFFSSRWSAWAEANYYGKGQRFGITFTDVQGNPLGTYDYTYGFNYLSVPLGIKFTGRTRFFGYAGAAIVPSFLLKAYVDAPNYVFSPGSSVEVDGTKRQKLDYIKPFELSCNVTVGMGYRLTDRFMLALDARVYPGLTRFSDSPYWGDTKHLSGSIGVGLKYNL